MPNDFDPAAVTRGHPIRCAYCHREIKGTPIEKNGYLYDSDEHARADDERPPQK